MFSSKKFHAFQNLVLKLLNSSFKLKFALAFLQRTCEANPGGENSSFIFRACVKSVPLYHFKLAYVVLHMAVKEFSKPTSKNGEIGPFNLSLFIVVSADLEISLIHSI